MTTHRTHVLWILLVLVAVSFASASQSIESGEDVIAQLRDNAHRIEDLDATITVETYEDGAVKLTQRLRLSLLQPDRMRQEYLEPDYLAGNLTLIAGNDMRIYIAAADLWFDEDLGELSTAEQPWLVFRQFLRGVEDEFADYTFDLLEDDDAGYHLVGIPTTEDATYGRIELWVDPETFVPSRRRVYDVEGNLLVDLHVLEVEEIADSTYLAQTMETYDENDELKSVIRYEETTVNGGLDPTLFERPEEAGDG